MAKSKENLVDEGFRVSLVETAFFDGKFEIPHINAPDCKCYYKKCYNSYIFISELLNNCFIVTFTL